MIITTVGLPQPRVEELANEELEVDKPSEKREPESLSCFISRIEYLCCK